MSNETTTKKRITWEASFLNEAGEDVMGFDFDAPEDTAKALDIANEIADDRNYPADLQLVIAPKVEA